MDVLNGVISELRSVCASLPDKRTGSNIRYEMADFGLSAFSLFFMQSPSFLAHQRALSRARERSNCETLFAMSRIPTDNQIRAMLDPVTPDRLYPLFASLRERLETGGGLRPFRRLDGHLLVALDGTEYFCSRKISCSNCSRRKRGDGAVEYHHNMVTAALVAPGHARAIPLAPEFVVPQDGQEKQDCESRATRRWLAAHGPGLARLKPIYIGDDLYSRQPICEAVQAVGGHFLFVAKPGSHPTLHDWLDGVELPVYEERVKKGRGFQTHRYRWLTNLPIRDGKDPLTVNWLDIEIINTAGNVTCRNSFVTDLAVDRSNVAELAACGRARWKIENETFNVLKNNGYHLEHNFGHGKENLSALLATLNLFAFACHGLCESLETAWEKARDVLGSRQRFFEHLRTITSYLVFPSWSALVRTLRTGQPPPARASP